MSLSRRLIEHSLINKYELLCDNVKKVCYLSFAKLFILTMFNSLCLFFTQSQSL